MKRIVIVGGGFTGVTTAVRLAAKKLPDTQITLISPRSYFNYTPGLFHLLTGFSARQLAIPFDFIFEHTGVLFEKAEVTSVNTSRRVICTGADCQLHYDYLVLAPGSVVNYYDMEEFAGELHTVSTVDDTLELRRSIHEMLTRCHYAKNGTVRCGGEVLVIGGGANGVESAAEIALLVRQVTATYQLEPHQVKVQLSVSGDRVTPMFTPAVSQVLHEKLISLGVEVTYNKRVTRDEMATIHIPQIRTQGKIVLWSTGMKLALLCEHLTQFAKDTRGKVQVDAYMRALGTDGLAMDSVYIGGDLAATVHSGLAQTAQLDAYTISGNIARHMRGQPLRRSWPVNLGAIVAMGRDWAIYVCGSFHLSGWLIWYLRRLVDLKSYLHFLSLPKAWTIFRSEHETWEEFDAAARGRMEEKYKTVNSKQ